MLSPSLLAVFVSFGFGCMSLVPLDGRTADLVPPGAEGGPLRVLWKRELGSGYSGIAIGRGRVVTLFSDGALDHVIALDPSSGDEIWRHTLGETFSGQGGSDNGPSSTPVLGEDVVYALGPRGELLALDLRAGRKIWSRNIVAATGARQPLWGFCTTPVLEGDLLIVQTGGGDSHQICAFEAGTGEIRWSRGGDTVSYQSPAVMTLAGRRQLVAVSNARVLGLDPGSGELLWSHAYGRDELDGSARVVPVREGEFLLTPSSTGGWWPSAAMLFRVSERGEAYEVERAWESRALRQSYARPVVFEDHMYGFNGGFLVCADIETGEQVWKSRPPGGQDLALLDDKLVIFSMSGDLVLAEASPEGYREAGRIPVSDTSSFSGPSVGAGRVLVRNQTVIAAIEVSAGRERSVSAEAEPLPESAEGDFGSFLASLERAADKRASVEAFLKARPALPLVEEDGTVHFLYHGEAEDVALFGPMTDLFRTDPLRRVEGTNLFYRSYRFGRQGRIEYVFEVDYDAFEKDPRNPRSVQTSFGEFSEVVLPEWEEPAHVQEHVGARGRIESLRLASELLGNERVVEVYLPPRYDDSDDAYPLLVVNDGGSALGMGAMDRSLDNLIGEGVAPIVVAFVPKMPIPAFYEEYLGHRGADYARMLVEELLPLLEDEYRILPAARSRAILGFLESAQVTLLAALDYPDVFGRVSVQSVRLRPPIGDTVLSKLNELEAGSLDWYLAWNEHEYRDTFYSIDYRGDSLRIAAALEARGQGFRGGESPGGGGWGSMRARTDAILRAFFPGSGD